MPKFIIVGAGDIDPSDLAFKKAEGDLVCAADAGYLALLKAGITADLIIGDFDSMPEPADTKIEMIKLPVVKDDTDISFCIKEGVKRGYRDFLILGALGGKRLSHTIANIQLLSMLRDLGADGSIVFKGTKLRILKAPEECVIQAKTGDHFSIYALSDEIEVTLKGLFYPLDHGIITRGFPLGVSNHFTDEAAYVAVHRGEALIITEKQ